MTGMKFRNTFIYLYAAMLLATAPGVAARTYKWVDENGVTQYSQKKPAGRQVKELSVKSERRISPGTPPKTRSYGDPDCLSVICRAERLGLKKGAEQEAERQRVDEAAKAAAGNQIFPTKTWETTSERVDRLVAECKAKRGARCDSREEKRRLLLNDVNLTQDERRGLRDLSPAEQRRQLEQRIPEEYRGIENSTESYRNRELRRKYGKSN